MFLDRDGVINRHVWHAATGEYEPPHAPEEFELFPWTIPALVMLRDAGYALFVVSNQPDYAKRKTSLAALDAVKDMMLAQCGAAGIAFAEYADCRCHPDSTVDGYGLPCPCRKPSPWMIQHLLHRHRIDAARSWMIGDRGSDIDCGAAAGVRTIQVRDPQSKPGISHAAPTLSAENLLAAAGLIVAAHQAKVSPT